MPTTKRLAALTLVALCALLGLAFPSQAATPKQVLVIGDSIPGGASNYISFYMGHDGKAQVTFRSVGGFAICDLLPGNGGPWTYGQLFAEKRYDAVVVAFSGNSSTRCMGGRTGQAVVDKYRTDATSVMRTAQQYGVPRVVWVKPPAAQSAPLDYVRTGVGRVYTDLPATWPTARVIDGGVGVELQGQWARYLPCQSWDKPGCWAGHVPIGAADGVHFYCAQPGGAPYGVVQPCRSYSAGSNRYGMNLAATRALIGLP